MDGYESLEARTLLAGIVYDSSQNRLTITGRDSADVIAVSDSSAGISVRLNSTRQVITGTVYDILIDARGGDDVVTCNGRAATIRGGAGNDTINTNSRSTIDGGLGADVMTVVADADDPVATLDYSSRTHAVFVSLTSGSSNNGEAGEHDKIVGEFRTAIGGSGNDSLTGTAAN